MAPTLYTTPASPPARSVLICAKALQLELNLKEVNILEKEHLKPEYLKINPQHTIPTLVDEDGFIVTDSHAIMTYLVGKYGKGSSLYPTDLKKRSIVDQRLSFDIGTLFARGKVIGASIIFGEVKEVKPELKESLAEAFQIVETFLGNNKYIAGDELSIADFCYATSITSFSILVPIQENKFPKISAWLKRIERLPYFGINKPGLEALHSIFKSKLSQ